MVKVVARKVPRGLDKALEKAWKGRDVTLRELLDGDHMRCFEQFHASGEERNVIEEWRKRAGRR